MVDGFNEIANLEEGKGGYPGGPLRDLPEDSGLETIIQNAPEQFPEPSQTRQTRDRHPTDTRLARFWGDSSMILARFTDSTESAVWNNANGMPGVPGGSRDQGFSMATALI